MRAHCTLAVALLLFLAGCGGDDPEPDAGPTDAEVPMDAGVDAATAPDAAPQPDAAVEMDAALELDGGADAAMDPDSGPPTREELATEITTDRETLDSEIAAVPSAMRVDPTFANLDLAAAGIDELIGEDGLMTLSLSDATVRALADLRAAEQLLLELDQIISSLLGRAEAAGVRTAAIALRDSLAAYRDDLRALYRERLDLGIVGSPMIADPYFHNGLLVANGVTQTQLAVVEGRASGDDTAQVTVQCFPFEGQVDIAFDVTDLETGDLLLAVTTVDTASDPMTVPFDATSAVVIQFTGYPTGAMGFWEDCTLSITTRRRLRAARLDPSTVGASYDTPASAYFTAVSLLEGAIGSLESMAVDTQTLYLLSQTGLRIRSLASPFAASDLLPVPREDIQRIAREAIYVRAMVDAVLASAVLSNAQFDSIKTHLGDAMTALEQMLAALVAAP